MARKILLADDSVTAQNMGRRILSDAGYEVITVNNGSAAIKKIAEIKPDIVMLDVYMPGYGGLEICQRIRETPELARIPVLLTVGKLEPFRAEDSLRVRADAFVIKPFEASELLTALTKLEDKIVPSGQPFAGGRFARAIAAVENSASGAREFGDADTGWKTRLKIPAPYSKPHPSPNETQPGASVSDAPPAVKAKYLQTEKVASILPEPAASALPHDVTPEEIAAITAAAALLAGHSRSAREPEGLPAIEAAPEPQKPTNQAPAEAVVHSGLQVPADVAVEQVAAAAIPASFEPDPVIKSAQLSPDDEVTAALDALAPTANSGSGNTSSDKHRPAQVNQDAAVTTAAAGEIAQPTGPRWIAAEVPVSEEESALVLDLEMQRTYAAFAAADAARSIIGDYHSDRDEGEAPEYHEPVAIGHEPEPHSSDTRAAFDASPQMEEQAIPGQQSDPVVSESPAEPIPPVVETGVAAVEAEPEDRAAYAVASASAGEPFVPEVSASGTEVATVSAAVSEPVSHPHDSALAAAWANWKQVREAVVIPESISQTAEPSAKSLRELGHEDLQHIEAVEAEASEESAEEASEIANIVDSVLADLKPKLMKEISQKMGKGKRKK